MTHARILELDGLRAIAVTAVVISHAWPGLLPGGWLGVDIFFVLSGFLVTRLILADLASNRFSFTEFYRRRLLRLMPAFFLMMFATLLLSWLLHTPKETSYTITTAFFASLISSNVYLPTTGGYFDDPEIFNPLLHTWSLGIEEQFYIIFPVALFLLWRLAKPSIAGAMSVIVLASLSYAVWLSTNGSDYAHYSFPARAWELLSGSLLALHLHKRCLGETTKTTHSKGFVLIAAAAILTVIFVIDAPDHRLVLQACAVVGALAFIVVCATSTHLALLRHRTFVYVGALSYALYLWHQPVMAFLRLFAPDSTPTFLLVAGVLSSTLAVLTYHFIEQPARRSQAHLAYVTGLVALGVILVFSMTFAAIGSGNFASRYSSSQAFVDLQDPDQELAQRCSFYRQAINSPEFCTFPPTKGDEATFSLAIWGDSHAMALTSGFIGLERDYEVVHLGMNGCRIRFATGTGNDPCALKHNAALDRILLDKSIKVILIHSIYQSRPVTAAGMNAMAADIRHAVTSLVSDGRQVIVLGPVPIYPADIPGALMRSDRLGLDLTPRQSLSEHHARPHRLGEEFLAEMHQLGAITISADPALCPSGECLVQIDGHPLYLDDEHLSVAGATLLAKAIDQIILDLQ